MRATAVVAREGTTSRCTERMHSSEQLMHASILQADMLRVEEGPFPAMRPSAASRSARRSQRAARRYPLPFSRLLRLAAPHPNAHDPACRQVALRPAAAPSTLQSPARRRTPSTLQQMSISYTSISYTSISYTPSSAQGALRRSPGVWDAVVEPLQDGVKGVEAVREAARGLVRVAGLVPGWRREGGVAAARMTVTVRLMWRAASGWD
jgi:hypothetical protein